MQDHRSTVLYRNLGVTMLIPHVKPGHFHSLFHSVIRPMMDGQNNCRVSGLRRHANCSALHGRGVLDQKSISNMDSRKQTSHTNHNGSPKGAKMVDLLGQEGSDMPEWLPWLFDITYYMLMFVIS